MAAVKRPELDHAALERFRAAFKGGNLGLEEIEIHLYNAQAFLYSVAVFLFELRGMGYIPALAGVAAPRRVHTNL